MGEAGRGPIAIGDVSFEHGGAMPGHETHARGLDVDIRIMRRDERQCAWGANTGWRSTTAVRHGP